MRWKSEKTIEKPTQFQLHRIQKRIQKKQKGEKQKQKRQIWRCEE